MHVTTPESPKTQHTGNLSATERTVSALSGVALSLIMLRGKNPLVRALAGLAAAGLGARAYAGHCAIKAAVTKQAPLREGISDQWRRMSNRGSSGSPDVARSPTYDAKSNSVDESVEESFPASDPPASRMPDEPPSNAEAKWDAMRAAQTRNSSS